MRCEECHKFAFCSERYGSEPCAEVEHYAGDGAEPVEESGCMRVRRCGDKVKRCSRCAAWVPMFRAGELVAYVRPSSVKRRGGVPRVGEVVDVAPAFVVIAWRDGETVAYSRAAFLLHPEWWARCGGDQLTFGCD